MQTPLCRKLKFSETGQQVVLNAPEGLEALFNLNPDLLPLPGRKASQFDGVFLFPRDRLELDNWIPRIFPTLSPNTIFWVAYPKKSSAMTTDLSRDRGWEYIAERGYQGVALVSVNADWTAARFRPAALVVSTRVKISPVLNKETETRQSIIVPSDLKKVFQKEKQAVIYFQGLSYSNRKEYIKWIESAKRPETRQNRLTAILRKLKGGKRNPSEK